MYYFLKKKVAKNAVRVVRLFVVRVFFSNTTFLERKVAKELVRSAVTVVRNLVARAVPCCGGLGVYTPT